MALLDGTLLGALIGLGVLLPSVREGFGLAELFGFGRGAGISDVEEWLAGDEVKFLPN